MTREERRRTVGKPTSRLEMVTAEMLDDAGELTGIVERLGEDDGLTVIGAAQALRVGADVVEPESNDPHAELPLAWFGGAGVTYEIARDGTVRPSGWRAA